MRWLQRWQPQSLPRGWGRDPKAPLARGSCAPRAKNKLEVLRLLGPGGAAESSAPPGSGWGSP